MKIRKQGKAGRITIARPEALNAITFDMCMAMVETIGAWQGDDTIDLVMIDAEGDRAFFAGGDVAEIYRAERASDTLSP